MRKGVNGSLGGWVGWLVGSFVHGESNPNVRSGCGISGVAVDSRVAQPRPRRRQ